MKYLHVSVFATGAAAYLACAAPALSQNTPVLEFTNGIVGSSSVDQSAGWSFTVNSTITVLALDAYVGALPGQVRLYDAGGLIAFANITAANPIEGSPILFYTQPIVPTVLTPGQYYIAEDQFVGTAAYLFASPIVTNPAITYGAGVDELGLGADPTADINGGVYNAAYFGPDFDIAATPEPSPLVWATGLLCVAGLAARRRLFPC